MNNYNSTFSSPIQTSKTDNQILKLLMIGESGVGKSAILTRYCDSTFVSTYLSTIGVDFKIKTVEIDGKPIDLQLWDTAGQERFRSITTSYYRGAQGIILVFDLTDRSTFTQLNNWLEQISEYSLGVKLILVGNKSDLKDKRQVSQSEASEFARSLKCEYIETSAKTDEGINEMIYKFSKNLLDDINHKNSPRAHTDESTTLGSQLSSFGNMISCGACNIL